MARYWVVAADASHARLFSREKKFSALEEVEDLAHPESRLHRHEMERDRPGSVQESTAYGESPNAEPTDPKVREAEEFAQELARRLEKGRKEGAFQELVIAAAPKFLGMLRQKLDAPTRDTIACEVSKNVTREPSQTIAKTVDEAFG